MPFIKLNKIFCAWVLIATANALAETEKSDDVLWSVIAFIVLFGVIIGSLFCLFAYQSIHRKKLEKRVKEVKEGTAEAYYDLGYDLCTSEFEDRLIIEGIVNFLKAAELKYKPGLQQAKKYLKSVKNKKPLINLCKEKGNDFFKRKEYDKALIYYEVASEAGDATATYNLGVCYFNGFAVEKNTNIALDMFFEAAQHEQPMALYQLGCCYENGNGVPKDLSLAIDCYARAARKGVNEAKQKMIKAAQNSGDSLYNEGKIDQAALLYEKVVDAGETYYIDRAIECSVRAGDIYYSVFEESKDLEDIKKAIEYYRIAAKYGDLHAQYYLGLSYLNNEETKLAFKWMKNVAQREHGEAQYYCGFFYENGIGTDKNYIQALYWYKKAVQNGIAEAKERIERFEKYNESANDNFSKTNKNEIDPYQILETNRQASNDEVKQAYFNKVKNLHPDFLKSKGLSEEIIKLATAELAKINLAWEMIKKERGL